ncbi:hypothetical protein [Kutzneria albida]|nr:hypothetical protein [Kutzneria albida]
MASTLMSRPAPALRRDQRALVEAIRRLPDFRTVAVLRGFDKSSRATKDALLEVVRERGGHLVDLTPIPGLGELSATPQADLVVATNRALTAAAERCGAMWNVPVVVPGEIGEDSGRLIRTHQPAVLITRDNGRQDVVVRELRLLGRVAWTDGGGRARDAEELVLRPTAEGMVVTAVFAGVTTTRPAARAVAVEVGEDVVAEIDGQPNLVVPGSYHGRLTTRPVCRLSVVG